MDDQRPPLPDYVSKRWLWLNALGAALCLGVLGAQRALTLSQMDIYLVAGTALIWGGAQWWVLRLAPLRVSWLWIAVTVVGWLASLPMQVYVTSIMPQSSADIRSIASTFDFAVGAPWLNGIIGLFAIVSFLAFFGFLASFFLGLGQSLYLRWIAREPVGGQWWGRAAWGWTMGLFAGGCLTVILVASLTGLLPFDVQLPYWFVTGCVGAVAGGIYGLMTADLLDGRGDDWLDLDEHRQQFDASS